MKILIVGGAGYIGSHVAKLAAEHGHNYLVFDDLSTGHEEFVDHGKLTRGSLADRQEIAGAIRKFHPDAVMHFAARSVIPESEAQPLSYYQANVVNSINLFQAAIEYGCRTILFSSTAAVYGIPKSVPIRESSSLAPINTYGKTKRMIECILEDLSEKNLCTAVILRYFNAAGASPTHNIGERHNPETHLIPNILNAVLESREVQVFGTDYPTPDGTCVRDYIHVDDLATAHISALEHASKTQKSETLNLGSETGFSVLQIIETAERVTGKKIRYDAAPRRSGDPPVLVADGQRAYREIGWRPSRSLEEIIKTAWKWHSREQQLHASGRSR